MDSQDRFHYIILHIFWETTFYWQREWFPKTDSTVYVYNIAWIHLIIYRIKWTHDLHAHIISTKTHMIMSISKHSQCMWRNIIVSSTVYDFHMKLVFLSVMKSCMFQTTINMYYHRQRIRIWLQWYSCDLFYFKFIGKLQ